MSKILIAMCTPGVLEAETNECVDLIIMDLRQKGIDAISTKTEGVYVFKQRNLLAKNALQLGCSHLFFIDNDMVVPSNIISRFLAYDKDIISTNYIIKAKRGRCSFSCVDENFKTIPLTENSVGLQKVYAAPTGTMLIKTSVFEKLQYPYFMHPEIEIGDKKDELGEDTDFCVKANKAGFDIWVDNDLGKQIEHIGKRAFNWKDAI